MEQFNADTRSGKVNLSIGLYYNEDSIVPQLETIIEAQKRIEPKTVKPNFICQWKASNLTVKQFKHFYLVQTAQQLKLAVL